jgi:hypothetical protein
MAVLTSWKLSSIAAELTSLRDALDERVGDFDDVVTSTRTALDLLDQTWRGPLPDDMESQLSTYLDGVDGSVGCTGSSAATERASRCRSSSNRSSRPCRRRASGRGRRG